MPAHGPAEMPNVMLMIDQFVAQELLEVSADQPQSGNSVNDVSSKMITVNVIHDGYVKGGSRRAFF
jgi:hypothetical protein